MCRLEGSANDGFASKVKLNNTIFVQGCVMRITLYKATKLGGKSLHVIMSQFLLKLNLVI